MFGTVVFCLLASIYCQCLGGCSGTGDWFSVPLCGCSSPTACSAPSFQAPSFSSPSFQIPSAPVFSTPSPCALPSPPQQEGCSDQFRSHFDSANRQGSQDSMRALGNTANRNSAADNRCAAQSGALKLGADTRACNNRFHEVNENEVLCHKKNARTECGDNAARQAAIDMDAANSCRAAQAHNDAASSCFNAGRDASMRAEDTCLSNADGFRQANSLFQPRCF